MPPVRQNFAPPTTRNFPPITQPAPITTPQMNPAIRPAKAPVGYANYQALPQIKQKMSKKKVYIICGILFVLLMITSMLLGFFWDRLFG